MHCLYCSHRSHVFLLFVCSCSLVCVFPSVGADLAFSISPNRPLSYLIVLVVFLSGSTGRVHIHFAHCDLREYATVPVRFSGRVQCIVVFILY